MIVGTARPELYEQHPDFGSGLRNANRDQPGTTLIRGDGATRLGTA